jgi:tetratricopeptide (TPR) repeat protein
MKILISSLLFLAASAGLMAQKSQVQSAWRSLSDYEELRKENPQNPQVKYLNKAKEAIDKALLNEETKNQTKTHAYKMRISYAIFQFNLNEEIKRQEAEGVQDKMKRYNLAYGKTSLVEFNEANIELGKIKELDPKFIEKIQISLAKNDAASLDDEDLKFALAAQEMKQEAPNIAIGKYETKEYGISAEYFYKAAFMNSILYKELDTANFYNACVAAAKSGDAEKVIDFNKKMLDAKLGTPYNYNSISNAYLAKGDTSQAMQYLKKGRDAFPSDGELLSAETDLFLVTNRQEEALRNLIQAFDKNPSNGMYCFMIGTAYDNLANPKDKSSGKDLPKPIDFETLFKSAETYYIKAIPLNANDKEFLFNSKFNLGALYNNYAIYIENKGIEKLTDMSKLQKENAAKSQEYYKKAIPYLEQALDLKPEDKDCMKALRQLYYKTDNTKMAKEMNDRLGK